MKNFNLLLYSLSLLSGLAMAQAQITVVRGYASNQVPVAGYNVPFVPLVNTPSVSLTPVAPAQVGASNATFGNVAGASNSTLDIVSGPSEGAYFNYLPGGPMEHWNRRAERPEASSATFGGNFQSSEGLASLAGKSSSAKKASRTYTNQDIPQADPNVGTVKYNGKTEHWN